VARQPRWPATALAALLLFERCSAIRDELQRGLPPIPADSSYEQIAARLVEPLDASTAQRVASRGAAADDAPRLAIDLEQARDAAAGARRAPRRAARG